MRGCFVSRSIVVLTPGKSSILIDNFGRARIANFGLATVTQNRDSIGSEPGDHNPGGRWIAPEILHCYQGSCSKPADVFSFAMVIIEVRHGPSPVS